MKLQTLCDKIFMVRFLRIISREGRDRLNKEAFADETCDTFGF